MVFCMKLCCCLLYLLERPIIEESGTQEFTVSAGETVDIPCATSGIPEPKVTWTYEDRPLSSVGTDYVILVIFKL